MAGKVFVLGDTHFYHKKAVEFRNCESVEAMNDLIMAKIIETVGARDTLVLLGDVIFGTKDKFDALLEKWIPTKFKHWVIGEPLPFILKVTAGNHDRNTLSQSKYINVYQATLTYRVLGCRVILSHIPLHECEIGEGKRWNYNIHGHLHFDELPNLAYINAAWEQFEKPVCIQDLIAAREIDVLASNYWIPSKG